MRATTCLVLVGLAVSPSDSAEAQLKLNVRHNENKTIVMRYLPRNRFGTQAFYRVELPANTVTPVTVSGEDPWFVNCYIQGEATTEVQISQDVGMNLTAMAQTQTTEPYELQLSFVETRVNGQRRTQTMSGTLNNSNGDGFSLFNLRNDGDNSDIDDFVARRWSSKYEAIDGSTVPATLDFRKQIFITPGWTGRFNAVAVIEGEDVTRACARWSTPDGRFSGDVFFTFNRQNPDIMQGTYTVHNDNKVRRWWAD